jgi:hypothetical protein
VDDEAAARDVARRERAPREARGLRLDEVQDRGEVAGFAVVTRHVAEEGPPEGRAA